MDGSESADFFRDIAESIPQFVWTTRPDGYHEYFNQRWLNYTGLTLNEAVGDGWSCIIHPEDYQRCLQLWKRSILTAERYEIELRLRHRDGAFRWHLGRAAPVKDTSGNVIQWFGTCTDIHAQKRLSQDRAELLAAISIVSKNPLIGAIRALELLVSQKPGALNEAQLALLGQVIESNKAMTSLLRKLIDTLGQDPLSSRVEETDLNTLLHSKLVQTMSSARAKDIRIEESVPAEQTLIVGDTASLGRVLQNLVENAITSAPHGGRIDLSIQNYKPFVVIEVSDNGPSIPAEVIPLLFQRLPRAKSDCSYEHGSGLSLYLCKQIVTAHHGQIWCMSRPGGGTSFYIVLPIKPPFEAGRRRKPF